MICSPSPFPAGFGTSHQNSSFERQAVEGARERANGSIRAVCWLCVSRNARSYLLDVSSVGCQIAQCALEQFCKMRLQALICGMWVELLDGDEQGRREYEVLL